MNLFGKFIERNNVFEKLKQGSDESMINVCNSIMTFISNGSIRGSQPTMSVDEILMIFLEYITISTSSQGIKIVLLCIESISNINKKHADCVLQTGLVGAIVDLLQNIGNTKFKKKPKTSNDNGFIIIRMLSYFTDNDKRSCLIFRLHHGIHSLLTFIESNVNTNNYNQLVEYSINICHNCVFHAENSCVQMFESNGLELCLKYISNYKEPSITKPNIITYCINLICSICKLIPKINNTFIEIGGFKIIVTYLCQLVKPIANDTKSNVLKLLQLISAMCMDNICAKTMVSNGTLKLLYPFLFIQSQNEEIKCIASRLLTNILRYGMKDIINTQCKLYKFNETHTKIVINKNITQIDEIESIQFPELESIKKRKEERQQPLKESQCLTKSIIPFITKPPLYEWSQILPKDLQKMKENNQRKISKRKKRNSLTINKRNKSPTFNKSKKATIRRRKSASFVQTKPSLLIKNTAQTKSIALPILQQNKHKTENNNNKSIETISDVNKYVSLNWIKNYYTKTTQSYLDKRCSVGETLTFQPPNLIIKLLYQEIITKSQSDITFIPKIIYDRNKLLTTNTYNNNIRKCKQPKPNLITNDNIPTIPTLEFESRFECGNLHRVIQTGPIEYDLLVSSDYNSTRHRQWFYFAIKNMISNVQYKCNIVNYDKNDSVYNRGCKPTIYSTKRFKESGVKWTRANSNETYYYSNAFSKEYQPKFTQIQPSMCLQSNLQTNNIENENKNENDSTQRLIEIKRPVKDISKNNSNESVSPSPSAQSAPLIESFETTKKLNYKQIRKRRARLRNKEKQKFKEKLEKGKHDANFTNVLHKDNGISFDILLSSTKKLNIIGRKKRKMNSNTHTHTIPTINNYKNIINKKEKEDNNDKKYHYTLSFTIQFPYSNDKCYLSYFYPFSYSDLQGQLKLYSLSPISNILNIYRRQLLCFSKLGNRIDLLTITNFNSTMNIIRDRPIIILSARVHPGETNSSFIMKGIIDFLLSKNAIASELRNQFVFKVVPCLNPDGVICGNHRCSLSGVDLNRQYQNPSHIHHPSIFYLKKLVQTINSNDRKIFLTCDIHGHSRMMNVTLYGCGPDADYKNNKRKLKSKQLKFASMDYFLPNYVTDTTERYKLFAHLLSQRAPNIFNYDQCIWNISKQKEKTSRVVFWRQFNIQNAFTMESSFCGSNLNYQMKGFHFNIKHFFQIGAKFCAALYDMSSSNQSNESNIKIENAIKQLKSMQNTQIIDEYSNSNKKIKGRKRKKI